MPGKVAINGLGRIGRAALKLAVEQPEKVGAVIGNFIREVAAQ